MLNRVSYKGYEIEVQTYGSDAKPSPIGHFTEVNVDGFFQLKLDFAAPHYALELAQLAIDLRAQHRETFAKAIAG